MKILILFSLFFLVSASSDARKAAERFIISYNKHVMLGDSDILHDEFQETFPNGTIRYNKDDLTRLINFMSSDETEKFTAEYKEFAKGSKEQWDIYWETCIAKFRPNGLLEIKFYENNKLEKTFLAKRDEYIEGGDKLYRIILH